LRSKLRNLLTIQTVKPNPKWLYALDVIDSTNNYAIGLLEDGLAHHGDVVWALEQTAGKGQRGKKWEAKAGDNIMMSLVVQPGQVLGTNPFHLNMVVANTITTYFRNIYPYWKVAIKWPNDIYINAKKTVGILIENVFRGSQWAHAIIGIGINVNQSEFPEHLANATSLHNASGLRYELKEIITDIRAGILNELQLSNGASFEKVRAAYNEHLFGAGSTRAFRLSNDAEVFEAKVLEVDEEGMLLLQTKEGLLKCASGSIQWLL